MLSLPNLYAMCPHWLCECASAAGLHTEDTYLCPTHRQLAFTQTLLVALFLTHTYGTGDPELCTYVILLTVSCVALSIVCPFKCCPECSLEWNIKGNSLIGINVKPDLTNQSIIVSLCPSQCVYVCETVYIPWRRDIIAVQLYCHY